MANLSDGKGTKDQVPFLIRSEYSLAIAFFQCGQHKAYYTLVGSVLNKSGVEFLPQ